jgi:hypothetical protein
MAKFRGENLLRPPGYLRRESPIIGSVPRKKRPALLPGVREGTHDISTFLAAGINANCRPIARSRAEPGHSELKHPTFPRGWVFGDL